MSETIRLTQYSHGGGCGCKIAPSVLQEILKTTTPDRFTEHLLVGNSTNDDAAAYDLGNGSVLISTTDFFMPIVDDAFDFGRIASANAISDVFAMGAKPVMAIAILGWPVDKLPPALAHRVLEGARQVCAEAGIPLAGGHSIDSPEPIFGLSVNGLTTAEQLKRNNTAREGDVLFLTKPIGVGILATAGKRHLLKEEHRQVLVSQLTQLNSIGAALGQVAGVHAMTDITGFGLAGHLVEMADGSGLTAEINYSDIALIDGAKEYLAQKAVPDATFRNWNSYSKKIHFEQGVDVMEAFNLLPDPQTNGGLLVAVGTESAAEVAGLLARSGYGAFSNPIGRLMARGEYVVRVKP